MRAALCIILMLAACAAEARPRRYAISQTGQVTKGLVSYWSMRNSGTTVYDEIGDNNGTASGTTFAYTNGVVGNGGRFDGVDDYIETEDIDTLSSISVCAWVQPNQDIIYGGVVSKRDDADGTWAWQMLSASVDNSMVFYINNGTQNQNVVGTEDIPKGTWAHVCGTYDGTTMSIYKDGILDEESTEISGNIANTDDKVRIGWTYSNTYVWNGSIDEVRIYNRALTPAEVQQLYRMGKTIYDNR